MHPKSSSGQLPPARMARIIHAGLIGCVAMGAALTWLAPGAPPAPDFPLRRLLGPAMAIGFVVAVYLRRWLPARRPGETADAWWSVALPKAIAAWVLLEATCLVGCVTLFLTGDPMALVWIAVGLLIFILMSPGRLRNSVRSVS